MAYDFAAKARHKAMNEKKASKKQQNSLFNAYKVMREHNDERSKSQNVQLGSEVGEESGELPGVQEDS